MVIARKLDRAEREFRTPQSKVRKFSHRAKPPPGTRVPFRTPQGNFRTVRIKVRKISHTTIQGVKFIPRCEILNPRCEFSKHQFRTPQSKVRKFSHRAKHSSGTRVPFCTPQANFHTVRNKVRKFRTPQFKVRNSVQRVNSSAKISLLLDAFLKHFLELKLCI